ncbi:hypothetical protein E2C01_028571 [Portunus trituberculatus]|uniref:Uncharacterized protein n=1 Tax=Portunus trituberculatus TaxID=210409 RepID=A0A5B7EP42_PORTR|nr:hypothetical protein [Portunus trituberculatus]
MVTRNLDVWGETLGCVAQGHSVVVEGPGMKEKDLGCVAQGHSVVVGGHGGLSGECSGRGLQGSTPEALQQGMVPPVDRTASMRGLVFISCANQFVLFSFTIDFLCGLWFGQQREGPAESELPHGEDKRCTSGGCRSLSSAEIGAVHAGACHGQG